MVEIKANNKNVELKIDGNMKDVCFQVFKIGKELSKRNPEFANNLLAGMLEVIAKAKIISMLDEIEKLKLKTEKLTNKLTDKELDKFVELLIALFGGIVNE